MNAQQYGLQQRFEQISGLDNGDSIGKKVVSMHKNKSTYKRTKVEQKNSSEYSCKLSVYGARIMTSKCTVTVVFSNAVKTRRKSDTIPI